MGNMVLDFGGTDWIQTRLTGGLMLSSFIDLCFMVVGFYAIPSKENKMKINNNLTYSIFTNWMYDTNSKVNSSTKFTPTCSQYTI